MKVVAFNGSARKNGNTAIMVRKAFDALEAEGVETEMIQMAGKPICGCKACYKCKTMQNQTCSTTDDDINDYVQKMVEADGIILASPVYFSDVTTEMKALIDRCGMVNRTSKQGFLDRKVGAGVVAVRRAGAMHTFDTLNHFFLISRMLVVGSTYWNIGHGRDKGEVSEDAEGMQTMTELGANMAWALKKLAD